MNYSKTFLNWVENQYTDYQCCANKSHYLFSAVDCDNIYTYIGNIKTGRRSYAKRRIGEEYNYKIGLAIAWAKYKNEKIPDMDNFPYTLIIRDENNNIIKKEKFSTLDEATMNTLKYAIEADTDDFETRLFTIKSILKKIQNIKKENTIILTTAINNDYIAITHNKN